MSRKFTVTLGLIAHVALVGAVLFAGAAARAATVGSFAAANPTDDVVITTGNDTVNAGGQTINSLATNGDVGFGAGDTLTITSGLAEFTGNSKWWYPQGNITSGPAPLTVTVNGAGRTTASSPPSSTTPRWAGPPWTSSRPAAGTSAWTTATTAIPATPPSTPARSSWTARTPRSA